MSERLPYSPPSRELEVPLHSVHPWSGIEESEADLMVEQAKNLSKAEIDALLEQIGGDTE